ncbi:hypothetical protein DIPPA_11557 [Diplonema papillatum]|nr:hypothetical protein DIPPA_11557 [Diplonema papillatum]
MPEPEAAAAPNFTEEELDYIEQKKLWPCLLQCSEKIVSEKCKDLASVKQVLVATLKAQA